jgi:NADH-quinone oxidoreductase subunit L
VTGWSFLIGALALSGIWPLSGFFSKEEILGLAFTHHRFLWAVATLTAGMTAFYMGRVFCVAFLNPPRREFQHLHEAPRAMTVPLILLATFSVIGGFLGIPAWLHQEGGVHVPFSPFVAIVSSAVALAGLGLAFLVYQRQFQPWGQTVEPVASFLESRVKFFVDDLYGWINRNIQQRLAIGMNLFERYVIIGLWVNGTARMTGLAGGVLRLAQTGKVQSYALALLIGLALVIYGGVRWGR